MGKDKCMTKVASFERQAGRSFGSISRAGAAMVIVLLLAGCGNDPWLRDDYFGKSWLEPERIVQSIQHDANGDAIVEKKK